MEANNAKILSNIVKKEDSGKIILRSLKPNWCEMSKLETSTESCSAFQMVPSYKSKLFNLCSHFKIHFWTRYFFVVFIQESFQNFPPNLVSKDKYFRSISPSEKLYLNFSTKLSLSSLACIGVFSSFFLTLLSSWISSLKSKRRRKFCLISQF